MKIKKEKSKSDKLKPGPGRPCLLNESQLKIIKYMAQHGATDKEISEVLEVAIQTVKGWKEKFPEFKEQLKSWKDEADERVERSLYERACGYSCPETKLFCHEGMIVAEDIIKHYPPDPTSMIFWLKNRKAKEWRDKQEHAFENAEDSELLKEVAELVKSKGIK